MTSITLMYASWCHFCQGFKPTWENIKVWCKKHNISANEFEDEQIQLMHTDPSKNTSGIPLDIIDGYPTIVIKYGSGDITKVADRSESNIIKMLSGKERSRDELPLQSGGCSGNSCGMRYKPKHCMSGGEPNLDVYKKKYLLYKTKYLKLKYGKP